MLDVFPQLYLPFDDGVFGGTPVDMSFFTDTDLPWSVLGAVEQSGRGSLQFTANDDGILIATVLGEQFPIVIQNVAPNITQVPDLSPGVIGATLFEGQSISLGQPTIGSEYQLPVLIDNLPVGNIAVAGAGTDVNELWANVVLVDPLGQRTSLRQHGLSFIQSVMEVPAEAIDQSSNFTMSLWLKTDSPNRQVLLSGANAESDSDFHLEIESGTTIRFQIGTEVIEWTGLPNLADNQYRHLAVTRNLDSDELELFIEGVSVGTRGITDQSRLSASRFAYGGRVTIQNPGPDAFSTYDLGETLLGSLDELTIWDRALNPTEIAELRRGSVDRFDATLRLHLPLDEGFGTIAEDRGPRRLDANLVPDFIATGSPANELPTGSLVYYPIDEIAGTSIADASGNGNNGTVVGGLELGQASASTALGTSASFANGTPDSAIAVPDLGTHNQVTFEAWINPRSLSTFDVLYNTDAFQSGNIHLQFFDDGIEVAVGGRRRRYVGFRR